MIARARTRSTPALPDPSLRAPVPPAPLLPTLALRVPVPPTLALRVPLLPTLALLAAVLVSAALSPASSLASPATLPTIERQVMCVTCKIPLNVAESAQANRERAFIRGLIARGRGEAQIKRALVEEYGPAVLALPSAKGFDLAAYLVPVAVVLALAGALAALLPGWRRRARAQREQDGPAPRLNASDAARLEADLERFD